MSFTLKKPATKIIFLLKETLSTVQRLSVILEKATKVYEVMFFDM